MTEPTTVFDDGTGARSTRWDRIPNSDMWVDPAGDPHLVISRHDGCWERVLTAARRQYGDPNIHYNTDTAPGAGERHLVFGDGRRLPGDGTLVYRDRDHTWASYPDGHGGYTYAPAEVVDDGTVRTAGPPAAPAGYRLIDGQYAPINSAGEQIGAQSPALPHPNGWHVHENIWTPENAAGDYYEIGPDGTRRYFDAGGHPVTADHFSTGQPGPGPVATPAPTAEQQSGATADAVTALHDKLKDRHSALSDAEERLATALLNAHAATDEGRAALGGIQHTIVAAIGNPDLALGTPAGEQALLKLLRGQLSQIHQVLDRGQLADADGAKAGAAVAALFGATTEGPGGADSGEQPAQEPSPAPVGAPMAPPAPAWAPMDGAGLGGEPAPLGDLGVGADPLAGLASMLPATLGGLPFGAGASALDPLAGLAGAGMPLAGLTSALGDQPVRRGDRDAEKAELAADDKPAHPAVEQRPEKGIDSEGGGPAPEPVGTPGQGAAPGGPAPAAAPVTTVALPDGSTAAARTPALAAAVRSYLAGTPLAEAYRQAGIELPPPGTPVTTPIDPAGLSAGAIGMFRDHYVVALSPAKALQDGQVVTLGSAAAGPDFLGWIEPSTPVSGAAAVASAPAPVSAPAPEVAASAG